MTPEKTLLITFWLKSKLDYTDFQKRVLKEFTHILANIFNQLSMIANHTRGTKIMKIHPQMPRIGIFLVINPTAIAKIFGGRDP